MRLAKQALWPKTSGHGACISENDSAVSIAIDRERLKMFEGLFQPTHLLVVFGIALLVLGPKKLPELGKGLGESIRGFKAAMAAKEEGTPVASKSDSNPAIDSQACDED